jgi:hypothetical protein
MTDQIGPYQKAYVSIGPVKPPVNQTDSATKDYVDTQIAAYVHPNGLNYSTSNGWISGGALTFDAGTTNFYVSAVVCRFTDYTDESNPAATVPITLGPWGPVASQYPGTLHSGIYVNSSGVLHQDTQGLNIPLLYGEWIRLGRLVHGGGLITEVGNSKYPVADRYDLMVAEFINNVSPINLGSFNLGQGTVDPLAVSIGSGSVWQQMNNVMADRTNPSTTVVAAVDSPNMTGLYGIAGTQYRTPTGRVLDLTQYNNNGTDALQPLTPGFWVNIPILLESVAGVYTYQYPTSQFSGEEYALQNLGKFGRLGGELQYYVVIGFITVEAYSADLSAATFNSGEYFCYSATKSVVSNSTGFSNNRETNMVWVDSSFGDDATGQVSYMDKPFRTFSGASTAISGASSTNLYLVHGCAGNHVEDSIVMKPFISFGAYCPNTSTWSITSGGTVRHMTLSSEFASASSTMTCMHNLSLTAGSGVYFDLYAIGGLAGSRFEFSRSSISGPVSYYGRGLGDQIKFITTDFSSDSVFDGGLLILNGTTYSSGRTITIRGTHCRTVAVISNVEVSNMTITAGAFPITVILSASNLTGTLTMSGANATLLSTRGSLPPTQVIDPLSTLTIRDAELTDPQLLGIQNAANALSDVNPVVDTQTLTAELADKVETSTTVNGHALSSNVTVSASDITTGTLPAAQLPTIPDANLNNPAAISVTGTASNLTSSGQTLPTYTYAHTPDQYDSTTKIATTAWVQNLRGASNGLASLVGGLVPADQIPSIGGLAYQGTFTCDPGSPGSLPAPHTASGQFWVVDGAGFIDVVHYDIGDWAIYNGSTFDRVASNLTTILSTWAGSANLVTVGTVTSGSWNATSIPSDKGGAGNISGMLKADGAGNVSAASHTTAGDYVAPDDSTTLVGVKTFTNGAQSTLQPAFGDYSDYLANTKFVRDNANVPQSNIVYVSVAGNDLHDGLTANNAVRTISAAVAIANASVPAPSPTNKFSIYCADGGTESTVTMDSDINLDAASMTMQGLMIIKDRNLVNVQCFNTPANIPASLIDKCSVQFSNTSDITAPACLTTKRITGGAIYVDSNQGSRSVSANTMDGLLSTETVIEVHGPNSILYVHADKINGKIRAISGGVVDLSLVNDMSGATFETLSGGVIHYPVQGAGDITGIIKCNGAGTFSMANPGTDYLVSNQTITLSSDVAGSGSNAISTTIQPNAVTLAKMATLAPSSVVGNTSTTLSLTPQAVGMYSTSNASTVMMRDSSSNAFVNNLSQRLAQHTTPHVETLTAASYAVQEWTGIGAGVSSCTLPNATTLVLGFSFEIINNASTTNVTIYNSASTALLVLEPYTRCRATLDDNGSAAGLWSITCTSRTPPVRLFTNAFTTPIITDRDLTAAELYSGPVQIGNPSTTTSVTLPTYANLISGLTSLLGFSPPNGFNFRTLIVSNRNNCRIHTGGASYFNSSGGGFITLDDQHRCAVNVWLASGVYYAVAELTTN